MNVFPTRMLQFKRTMATIGTLQRITADKLSTMLLAEQAAADPSVAVVDVRDDGACGLSTFPSTTHPQRHR